MTSEPRAWERPDGARPARAEAWLRTDGVLVARANDGWESVEVIHERDEPPSDAVPLHPVPDVTEDDPLRRSRTEVRADAFREAADLVDVLTTSWRNTGGRDSAAATAEVSKMLRGLARMEEEKGDV